MIGKTSKLVGCTVQVLVLLLLLPSTAFAQSGYRRIPGAKGRSEQDERKYCRRAIINPGANFNGYFKCLVDRGVYTYEVRYWESQARRHCNGLLIRESTRRRCLKDRYVQP